MPTHSLLYRPRTKTRVIRDTDGRGMDINVTQVYMKSRKLHLDEVGVLRYEGDREPETRNGNTRYVSMNAFFFIMSFPQHHVTRV